MLIIKFLLLCKRNPDNCFAAVKERSATFFPFMFLGTPWCAPIKVKHGDVSCRTPRGEHYRNVMGTRCKIRCKQGYEVQSPEVVCMANRHWSSNYACRGAEVASQHTSCLCTYIQDGVYIQVFTTAGLKAPSEVDAVVSVLISRSLWSYYLITSDINQYFFMIKSQLRALYVSLKSILGVEKLIVLFVSLKQPGFMAWIWAEWNTPRLTAVH